MIALDHSVRGGLRWREGFAEACYQALVWAGWLAVTAACVIGLWAMFFVFLGEFSFAQTLLHIDNFASRFVAAEPSRQAEFTHNFWIASGILFLLAGFFRRHSRPRFTTHGKEN